MFKRRAKRRYLSLVHTGQASDTINLIAKRCSDLFGSIAAEKAAIKLVRAEGSFTVMKCSMEQLDSVLVAIAVTDPPVATLDTSGSMKQLKRRH